MYLIIILPVTKVSILDTELRTRKKIRKEYQNSNEENNTKWPALTHYSVKIDIVSRSS